MKNLIYAVEDEPSIRELYYVALNGTDFEALCFKDAEELFDAVKARVPDLFILDIMLEKTDGYDILAKLKEQTETADIPCIIVSAKVEEVSKVIGLNLGADDYIAKPFGILELIARIKANIRKSKKTSKQKAYKDLTVDELKHTVTVAGKALPLTNKEYKLIDLMISNAETVMNREDIFKSVWGEDYMGETRTLDMHVKELRKKIADYGSVCVIETVRSVGYVIK
ncbi:MAG: response regulator transcription factor [Clostridia bacterium]|nr:response regulator transcription factor [Clostridia bacterium]